MKASVRRAVLDKQILGPIIVTLFIALICFDLESL